ncbi:MAG: RAD55 family ATPase [Methanomicrobiales archaeon]
MIPLVETGIQGFERLIQDEESGFEGVPENSTTLLYGPPNVGKSIFCYQFMYNGLLKNEPCLYITADYGIKQLQQRTMDFNWFIQSYSKNEMLYVIDALSNFSGVKIADTKNYKTTAVHNPTDLMVKVGIGTRFVFQKSPKFRSIFDSLTIPFAFNPDKLVIRVLKAFVKRVKEAGGVAIITHTEGTVNQEIEDSIKDIVDNVFKMDGKNFYIEKLAGSGRNESKYEISDQGIIIG